MKDKKTITKLIAKARKERDEFQRKIAGLDEVIRFLNAQLSTEESMSGSGISRPAGTGDSRFSGMKAPEAAEIVLRERGEPMHVNDIIDQILLGGYNEQTNRKRLYGNLFTRMRRKVKTFKVIKGKRATFGLVGVDKQGSLEVK